MPPPTPEPPPGRAHPTPWSPPAGPALPPVGKNRSRRWIPATIIAVGIVAAGAVVGAAVLINANTSARTVSDATVSAADSPTCKAWQTTLPALKAIPELPRGWTWDTRGIDTVIGAHSALVSRVLDTFEPQIADRPAEVTAAARGFVSARRHEILLLADRTYTRADGAAGDTAFARLNRLCGGPTTST